MKTLFGISILMLIGCSAPKKTLVEVTGSEVYLLDKKYQLDPGKCYGSAGLECKDEQQIKSNPNYYKTGFFLSEEKVKLKKRKVKITPEEIEKNKLPNGKIKIITQPAYSDVYIKTEGTEPYFHGLNFPDIYMFCFEYVPEKTVEISIKELEEKDFFIEKLEIIRTPKIFIKEPKKIPTQIKSGEIYCKAGCWIELREALLPIGNGLRPSSVQKIKRKLNEFGNYNLLINHEWDKKTRIAFQNFLKLNGLPCCNWPQILKILDVYD